jgi:hypothetical protein
VESCRGLLFRVDFGSVSEELKGKGHGLFPVSCLIREGRLYVHGSWSPSFRMEVEGRSCVWLVISLIDIGQTK